MNIIGKIMTLFGCLAVGSLATYVAFELGGIELLLAGVIGMMIIEGMVTFSFSWKWIGLFVHFVWAAIFYLIYSSEYSMFGEWQWCLLWGVLIVRTVLQPVYLMILYYQEKNEKSLQNV